MPISVVCPTCQKKLKAPDNAAGKRTKCPGCQGVLEIPAAEPAVATAPSAPAAAAPAPRAGGATWEVHTGTGETYGPITRAELDKWVKEGRVDDQCQLLVQGGAQWQWASDVFPQLASDTTGAASQVGPATPAAPPVPAIQTAPANPFSHTAAPNPYTSGVAVSTHRAAADDGVHPGAITISILSFVLAALNLFCGVGWAILGEWLSRVFFAVAAISEAAGGGDATGLRISGALIVLYGVSCMLHGILLIVAGIGLLVRAQWGRIMAICLGAFSLMLCIPYVFLLQYSVVWSLMMLVIYVGYGAATIAVLLTSGVARTYRRVGR